MSADLFAEFGATPTSASSSTPQQQPAGQSGLRPYSFFDDFKEPPATAPQPQQPTFPVATSTAQQNADDDDWGDFEGGSSSFEPGPPVNQDPFASSTPVTSYASPPAWQAPTQSNVELFSSFQPVPPAQTSWQKAQVIPAKKSADPSVLFDAEDDFGDVSFGDFEEPEAVSTNTTSMTSNYRSPPPTINHRTTPSQVADLLGDLDFSQPQTSTQIKSAKSNTKSTKASPPKKPASSFGTLTSNQRVKPTSTTPEPKADDAWDTFDDWEASIPTKPQAKAPSPTTQSKSSTAGLSTITSPQPLLSPTLDDAKGELPPTNVPPPAVLLTLFPPLFAEAQEKLFKPMAAQTLPMRNKILAEPGTIRYLQGYLMLASVAAHIIAGRKLRWKRDQHLSQGMRIGPASSRATSGMKLSSIDKGENMKEEREASDVVRVWKDQAGRLRHVVSAANQIKAGSLGAVPDMQETMAVKVLKQGEGGVPAAQACMLCGLKRDERVGAVDQGVEDSFGEWWVEQVNMHRSCRNFWGEHKDALRQR